MAVRNRDDDRCLFQRRKIRQRSHACATDDDIRRCIREEHILLIEKLFDDVATVCFCASHLAFAGCMDDLRLSEEPIFVFPDRFIDRLRSGSATDDENNRLVMFVKETMRSGFFVRRRDTGKTAWRCNALRRYATEGRLSV